MTIDLLKLREQELRKCNYSRTLEILSALEEIETFNVSGIQAIEDLETYRSITLIFQERLERNEFAELESNQTEKNYFRSRLNFLIYKFYVMLDLNNVINREHNRVFDWKQEVKAKVQEVTTKVQEVETKIDRKINRVKKNIKNTEHTTLSHVLSLMGIFSAVITLIISVVVTSSSWLNNADGASAPIAFIIPNLVTLIAIFSLMILVYYFVHHDDAKTERGRKRIKAIHVLIGIVVVLCLVVAIVFVTLQHVTPPAHVRYIIPSTQYEIVEEAEKVSSYCPHNNDCHCHNKIEIKKYFEITFEGKKYRFEYDESLKHGENLYFCEKHRTLE